MNVGQSDRVPAHKSGGAARMTWKMSGLTAETHSAEGVAHAAEASRVQGREG